MKHNVLKEIFAYFKSISANNTNIILYYVILVTAIASISIFAVIKLKRVIKRHRYKTVKRRKNSVEKFVNLLMKNSVLNYIINAIALKINLITAFSLEMNIKIASVVLLTVFAVLCIFIGFSVIFTHAVWYNIAANVVLILLFAAVFMYVMQFLARVSFTSKLPETMKILNSRYLSKKNIIKAINISIEAGDFNGAVKRTMSIIRNVLMKNDMVLINETFKILEKMYGNYYLTLLLNLIKQAHFKGGEEVIKEQMEEVTEEILSEIENKKDLSAAAIMYILLTAILPAGIVGIELFNKSAIGQVAYSFYSSPAGMELKIFILFLLILFIGSMLFLEDLSF